jgi:hypothetical protein
VTYRSFFSDVVPGLALTGLGKRCPDPIVMGFVLHGADAPMWTVRFDDTGGRAFEGMDEVAPLMTVATQAKDWDITQPRLVSWADRLADQAGSDHVLRAEDLARVVKVGGTVRLVATDYVDVDGSVRDLVSELWIGRYEEAANPGKTFSVTVTAVDYAGLLDGSVRPAAAFAEGRIQIGGNVGHAMKFGMAAMRLRPKKGSR